MTHTTKTTPTHFTLPAILPAMITGLFILTACGGSALTNDAPIATNTQKNTCEANPLADGCQADAGFLSVNDNANQEDAVSVAPVVNAPVAPEPVVKKLPAQKLQETPVVKKTEPVLKELAKKQTPPAPPPTPEPITSVDTHDFVPKTSYSTYSSPPSDGPTGQQSADVTVALITGLQTTRNTTLQNEFLAVGDWTYEETDQKGNVFATTTVTNRLNSGRGNIQDPLRMNLAEATYDGVKFKGDAKNGIDFFTETEWTFTRTDGQISGVTENRYHYAGILSGTDLGAPLTTNPTATWNGSFRTYNTDAVDFQLTVTFGATDDTRTISAFVKDTAWSLEDNYYLIAGKYTAAGLITSGTVNWGTFSDIALRTPTASRAKNGTLTGLIGVQGAVAVFISDTNDDGTSGGYAGGFVAAPSTIATGNTDVTFGDWTRDTARSTTLNTDTRANEFLVGGAIGLNTTGANNVISIADCAVHNANPRLAINDQLNCSLTDSGRLNVSGATFGEETDSGVAFFDDGSNYYAGLLSGTDLGAPITSPPAKGMWAGTFQAIGDGLVKTSFMLEVTFGEDVNVSGSVGSIEALVAQGTADLYYLLKGTYNDKGVIKGTVDYDTFTGSPTLAPSDTATNGILTGLIGQDGAVGAFISTATGATGYSGGFVASPITPDGEFEVVFADWTRSFDPALGTAPTTGTPQSEFLQATGGTLATGNLTDSGGSPIVITTLNLSTARFRNSPLGGDAGNGVAFYQGYVNSDGAGYAGIFDTTDLGGPITAEDARAEWHGQFQVVGSGDINTDFTLEVTFGGESNAAGRVEAFVARPVATDFYHYLSGTFSNTGVIKGTNSFGVYTGGDRNDPFGTPLDGVLTGLIGQDGAVGAFYANDGAYAGGFVARPFAPATAGATAFWAQNIRTETAGEYPTILSAGSATLTKTGSETDDDDQANFMRAGATALDLGADALAGVTIPATYNVNLGELVDSDDATSGFALAHAQSESSAARLNLYVGLLSGTDVGAPFIGLNVPVAEWTGILRLESPFAQISFNEEVDFTVGFSGGAGTITTDTINLGAGRLSLPSYDITINGQFGTDGVIYGTTTANISTVASPIVTGTLSGLIGVDGAVAVFTGNDASTNGSYAGGFVARPTVYVTYNSWLDSFDKTLATAGRHTAGPRLDFLQSNEAGDNLNTGTVRYNGNADVNNLTPLTIAGNDKHGVSFFSGAGGATGSDLNNRRFYAGMLSGTNVGRPLAPHTSGPVNAMWDGKIQSASFFKGGGQFVGGSALGTSGVINFKLEVDFVNERIEGFVPLPNNSVGGNDYHFLLKAGYNHLGQFTDGTIQYGRFPGNDRTATRTPTDAALSNYIPLDGKLTGVIGSGGAVGVFIGNNVTEYGFAGGFVASP